MINGIIKFTGSGLGKTATSEVSAQTVEFHMLLSELLKLILQNPQAEVTDNQGLFPFDLKTISPETEPTVKDLILQDNSILLMSIMYSPDFLNKINQDFEQLKSNIDQIEITFDKLKNNFNQSDFEIFKSNLQSSENLDNAELMSLLRSMYTSENLANSNTTYILKNYFEKITIKMSYPSKAITFNESLNKINENLDIFDLNKDIRVNRDESKVLLSSIIDDGNSKEENLLKNAIKEMSKGENITINDKNLANNEIISANSKSTEKTPELPVIRINEVSEALLKTFSTQNRTLIVQLEPPELGRIMIKLTLDNAGVKADLKVDYPHVKEMITGLIPEIKNNLQSSGIKLSDFVLDLMRDHREYRDSYQGQKRNRGNQKFIEYFA